MKRVFFAAFILCPFLVFSQQLCHDDILDECELNESNLIEKYLRYNFSTLWTITPSYHVVGIIGGDFQRIKIKILTVAKSEANPKEYLIHGKTNVKGNICDFSGKIIIEKIQEYKSSSWGIEETYHQHKIRTQGLLTASYEFLENKDQKHTGIFSGKLQSKWYITDDDQIKYDNQSSADGYFNNAFVGCWVMYKSNKTKVCNWADYRIPNVPIGFDNGAAEFGPNKKYDDKGWYSYRRAFIYNDEKYKKEELMEWWQNK